LEGPEAYFEFHRWKPDRPENDSFLPQIATDTYLQLISTIENENIESREKLHKTYSQLFPQWKYELHCNRAILLYGLGSKIRLLNDFVNYMHITTVVANGYNNTLFVAEFMKNVFKAMFPKTPPPRAAQDVLPLIKQLVKAENYVSKPLLIAVHSLDADALCSEGAQNFIASVAELPMVHLVASIDNFNAPMMWDARLYYRFKFVWHETHTFQPYLSETPSMEPTAAGHTTRPIGDRGLQFVLRSITVNARQVYRILTAHQLELVDQRVALKGEDAAARASNSTYAISLKDLYQLCLAEFVVSSELNLRTILQEFVEHQMAIIIEKGNGAEYVYIPF
ncbi:hypothetical protein CANCADRAFT_19833, partial [Tortispora caseinolytica NRRL Y-17796]